MIAAGLAGDGGRPGTIAPSNARIGKTLSMQEPDTSVSSDVVTMEKID